MVVCEKFNFFSETIITKLFTDQFEVRAKMSLPDVISKVIERSSMEMQCGQELQKAWKQSSIKRVPKFLTVKSKYLKVLWMLATVVFLVIGFYEGYKLLEEYFTYPKLTLLQERDFGAETGFVFPNILVCNVNQLGLFRDLPMDQNIEVYAESVNNYTECSNCTAEEVEWWASIRGHLISPYAYLQYLGLANSKKIMSQYQNFLIECLALKIIT